MFLDSLGKLFMLLQLELKEYAGQAQPENPRSSTTDDVECMFSIMRDQTFYLDGTWRKTCIEFSKRLDPDIISHQYIMKGRGQKCL